jgi:hypothetical protein
MNTWQILILNMVVILSSHRQLPKPLTRQQQQQFAIAFGPKNFKVPEAAL